MNVDVNALSKVDLVILICLGTHIEPQTFFAFERLRHQSKLKYRVSMVSRDALIGRARSVLLTQEAFENHDSDYFLFIDGDIVFKPENVIKIHADLKSGYDVVGGVYTSQGGAHLSSEVWQDKLKIPFTGEIKEIPCLATGFMGISRRIVEKMVKTLNLSLLDADFPTRRCYPFFESHRAIDPASKKPTYLSEDYDFCEKVRKAGGKVYLDTGVQLGHNRDKTYTVNEYYAYATIRSKGIPESKAIVV